MHVMTPGKTVSDVSSQRSNQRNNTLAPKAKQTSRIAASTGDRTSEQVPCRIIGKRPSANAVTLLDFIERKQVPKPNNVKFDLFVSG
ncbi:hypothetical protein PoB_002640200 [Plakobranchus ocellatus]|uniref:Uncharacterized protein n=1 Tax=Plakobranchus ocellatus TaxID=259542 RepID=A0AAV3ZYY9_9GAST|nr:hypothetical protein PoB_002640200 [Plakobranchus ocellatus]